MLDAPQRETTTASVSELSPERFYDEYRRPRSCGELPWIDIGWGTALAGGAFPVIVAAGWLLIGLPVSLLFGWVKPPTLDDFVATTAALLGGMLFLSFFALLTMGLAAAATLPLVAGVMSVLGIQARQTPAACFAGGLVAFVVCCPLWASIDPLASSGAWIALILFPGLVTPVGQFGAGYVAMLNEVIPWLRKRRTPTRKGHHGPARFSLRQLMLSMVVLSVSLTAARAAGLLRSQILVAVLFWLVYQYLLLEIVTRLVDWRHRRLIERVAGIAPGGST